MNVLILTDFSAQAYNAARYALNSTSGPSNFYVLHASNGEAAQMDEALSELVGKLKKQPAAKQHCFSALPFSCTEWNRRLRGQQVFHVREVFQLS